MHTTISHAILSRDHLKATSKLFVVNILVSVFCENDNNLNTYPFFPLLFIFLRLHYEPISEDACFYCVEKHRSVRKVGWSAPKASNAFSFLNKFKTHQRYQYETHVIARMSVLLPTIQVIFKER